MMIVALFSDFKNIEIQIQNINQLKVTGGPKHAGNN